MNIREIWKKRKKILEGMWYNHIVFFFMPKHWAFHQVKIRREICKSCEYLDKEGEGENVALKGKPACSWCGCNIKELTASLSSECSYEAAPKWLEIKVKDEYKIESDINIKDNQDDQICRK